MCILKQAPSVTACISPRRRSDSTDQGALDLSGPRFAVTTAPVLDVIE